MKRIRNNIKLLFIVMTIVSLFLIGCSDEGSNKNSSSDNNEKEINLDILSWWTAGGEAEALEAIMDGFEAKHPEVKIENAAVAGGGGSNQQSVLSTRLLGGDAPIAFQAQGGLDLLQWKDHLRPLNDLLSEEGWEDVIPKEIIEMNSEDGNFYGVPLNLHRSNVMYYNISIFDEYDLNPPKTFDDFFNIADKLQDEGITPLALGDTNPAYASVIFENILLANLGPDKFSQLKNGEMSWGDESVRESASIFKRMIEYVNDNHSSLDWQEAADLLIDGEAAMHIMGDFEVAYLISQGMEPNEDFGWTTTPGTEDMFHVLNDSIAFPEDVEHPDKALEFAKYLGSVEGQYAFNKEKGSLPVRTDVDISDFNEYGISTGEDYANIPHITLAFSGALDPGFATRLYDAVTIFVTQGDVDDFIDTIMESEHLLQE